MTIWYHHTYYSNCHQLTYPLVCHLQAPPPAYESVAHISNPSYMATVAADSSQSTPTVGGVQQEGEAIYVWYKIREHIFAEARQTSIRCETTNKMLSQYDRLMQGRRNSVALAMELRLSCTNPSIYWNPGSLYVFCNSLVRIFIRAVNRSCLNHSS